MGDGDPAATRTTRCPMHCPLCRASWLGPSGNNDTVRFSDHDPSAGASNRGTVAMPRNCDLCNPPSASQTRS